MLGALQTAPPDLQQAPGSGSSYAGGGKVNPAVAAAAQSTVERVFDHCQQVSLNPWASSGPCMGSTIMP